jgi:hypothetical protein
MDMPTNIYCNKNLARYGIVTILRNIQLNTLHKIWSGSLRTHYNTRLINIPKGLFIVKEEQSNLR